jgi:hypothetical protein
LSFERITIMKVCKITPGFVIQTYDSKTGRCVEQSFVGGDDEGHRASTCLLLPEEY